MVPRLEYFIGMPSFSGFNHRYSFFLIYARGRRVASGRQVKCHINLCDGSYHGPHALSEHSLSFGGLRIR